MIYISPIRNSMNTVGIRQTFQRISFGGVEGDVFESSRKLSMYNPYGRCYSLVDMPKDLTKPAKISLGSCVLEFNPERYDYLTDKQTGKKIKTMILKSSDDEGKVSYHFISEKLDKEYGYVSFLQCDNPRRMTYSFPELLEDNPKDGLVGKRLIVDYLHNFDDERIGGVGVLSDKLAVKHCVENDLPFNIVSVADRGSHAAHYIRGKRFFPIHKFDDKYRYEYLEETYGKTDINEIMKDLISENKGGKVRAKIGFVTMYMPKELVMKYLKELNLNVVIK